MVGLGRMGNALSRRLIRAGHEVVGTDLDAGAVAALEREGATGAASVEKLVDALTPPRVVWMMLPAAVVGGAVDELAPALSAGDIVIDGGNSFYRDDVERAERLRDLRIHYVDVGTSGGVHGLERGFCLMIGGEDEPVERLDPIFRALAPGIDAAPRTPGRTGTGTGTAEDGYFHCGPPGAGHFVKMVHNGIEYGAMAALAEGLNVLEHADAGSERQTADAETAPIAGAEFYRYDLDVASVAEVWRRGSVIASWLLDLTAEALAADPGLAAFEGRVSDSGEGRWTVQAAVDEGVPVPMLATALFARFASRGNDDFANRLLSAMRSAFGGHAERPEGGS